MLALDYSSIDIRCPWSHAERRMNAARKKAKNRRAWRIVHELKEREGIWQGDVYPVMVYWLEYEVPGTLSSKTSLSGPCTATYLYTEVKLNLRVEGAPCGIRMERRTSLEADSRK